MPVSSLLYAAIMFFCFKCNVDMIGSRHCKCYRHCYTVFCHLWCFQLPINDCVADANNGENTEECEKKEQRCRQTVEDRFADLTNLHKALKNASICQSHEDFTWDRQEDSQPEIGYAGLLVVPAV